MAIEGEWQSLVTMTHVIAVLRMGQTCVYSGCVRTCTNLVVDRFKLNSVKFTLGLQSIVSCCCETGRFNCIDADLVL